jgi:hypothetical protein
MNMDSNVKRQGWETCEKACHLASSPMKNRYWPSRIYTDGRFWEAFARPHQAGTPPVRDGLKDSVLDPTHQPSNRCFASEPTLASQRKSLALAAEIW